MAVCLGILIPDDIGLVQSKNAQTVVVTLPHVREQGCMNITLWYSTHFHHPNDWKRSLHSLYDSFGSQVPASIEAVLGMSP